MTKGILIDLAGVVYSGDTLLPGAADAINQLRQAGLPFRFITNTTSKPLAAILKQLNGFGLAIEAEQVFTPAQAAVAWLHKHDHSPHLLIHPNLSPDFDDAPKSGPPAVIIGDAQEYFTYANMNAVFRQLIKGAPLIALAANRVFLDKDNELSIDAGAFVRALEYSSGTQAILMGKPAPEFFAAAAGSMGLSLQEVAMIGDDAEADVAGALEAGVGRAVLVRTGKYRAGDEGRVSPAPSAVVSGIVEAVEELTNTE